MMVSTNCEIMSKINISKRKKRGEGRKGKKGKVCVCLKVLNFSKSIGFEFFGTRGIYIVRRTSTRLVIYLESDRTYVRSLAVPLRYYDFILSKIEVREIW